MSLNKKAELTEIAKIVCRDLRKNSTKAERVFWGKVRDKKVYGRNFTDSILSFMILPGKKRFLLPIFIVTKKN
jgi:very-short-patch-repair endonuclease